MIGRFLRTRKAATAPEPPPENPYVTARTNFESLFRNQAKEKHAWRIAALGQLVVLGVLVVAYVQLASGSRVVPYVVEVDQLGQAVAVAPAEWRNSASPQIVARELSTLIRNLRSVSSDPGLQVRMIQDAYAFLEASAARFTNEYFADPDNNPRVLGQSMTRTVEVMSVLPIPDSDSWRIQWTETQRQRSGGLPESRVWEAYLTVRQAPPTTVDAIRANPLGIYVSGINWTPIQTVGMPDGGRR
jgi:type IV secretion system protein VirB5